MALGLQREEWIKCSAHVLHGASLLQFSGYDKSAAEGHLSWRIQLGKKGEEVHSDIRELILELLSPPSNEALHSSSVTRLIWLAELRVHSLFKVTLKRLGVAVKGRSLKFNIALKYDYTYGLRAGERSVPQMPANMLR